MSFVRSYFGLQAILLIQQYFFLSGARQVFLLPQVDIPSLGNTQICSVIQTDFVVFFNSFFELCLNTAELRLDRI